VQISFLLIFIVIPLFAAELNVFYRCSDLSSFTVYFCSFSSDFQLKHFAEDQPIEGST
jgi:hypothetical protein